MQQAATDCRSRNLPGQLVEGIVEVAAPGLQRDATTFVTGLLTVMEETKKEN